MPESNRARLVEPLFAFLAFIVCAIPRIAASATLEADQYESTEGFYQLLWEAEEAEQPVRLVEARSPAFTDTVTVYTGSDAAHVVSGKPDGTWYYRLEAAEDSRILSEPVMVTVRHHSLGRAFVFFSIGAIVFVSTIGLIAFSNPGSDERR